MASKSEVKLNLKKLNKISCRKTVLIHLYRVLYSLKLEIYVVNLRQQYHGLKLTYKIQIKFSPSQFYNRLSLSGHTKTYILVCLGKWYTVERKIIETYLLRTFRLGTVYRELAFCIRPLVPMVFIHI